MTFFSNLQQNLTFLFLPVFVSFHTFFIFYIIPGPFWAPVTKSGSGQRTSDPPLIGPASKY